MNRTDKARIITEYQPQYSDPIEVVAGETMLVGDEDKEFPGWRWCRARDGRAGWLPVELILAAEAEFRVLEDYSARELSVKPGEEVTVQEARHGWLLVRNAQGERGWIPSSAAQLLQDFGRTVSP
ncbi:MAG TPA: SH3 domain-containing protein [Terriglobales bacterium]|nr:SH3 domain-containing protein [Terriglobales bacterium]